MMTTPIAEPQNPNRNTKVANKLTCHQQLHKMLTRKSGVTIAQLQKNSGGQLHKGRAAISAQRKAGRIVDRAETDKESVYRIVKAPRAR